jgi:hypothetical protein
MLMKNWRMLIGVVLILLIGFLLYMWKSTESEMRVKVADMNATITTMQSTIDHNRDELRKLEQINTDLKKSLDAKVANQTINQTAVKAVSKKTSKTKQAATKIDTFIDHNVPADRTVSEESAKALWMLVTEIEPMIDSNEGEAK